MRAVYDWKVEVVLANLYNDLKMLAIFFRLC